MSISAISGIEASSASQDNNGAITGLQRQIASLARQIEAVENVNGNAGVKKQTVRGIQDQMQAIQAQIQSLQAAQSARAQSTGAPAPTESQTDAASTRNNLLGYA